MGEDQNIGWVVTGNCAVKSLSEGSFNLARIDGTFHLLVLFKKTLVNSFRIRLNSKDIYGACIEADKEARKYFEKMVGDLEKILREIPRL